MFNVTVLKLRDVIKYACEIVFAILIIISISKYFNKESNEENINKLIQNKVQTMPQNSMSSCLDKTVPAMSIMNNQEIEGEEENEDILKGILSTQISSIKGIENQSGKESNNDVNSENNMEEKIELARNRTKNSSYNK